MNSNEAHAHELDATHHASIAASRPSRGNVDTLERTAGGTRITIFTVPKPFGQSSHTDLIQRNAIESWTQLSPELEVVLLGNEAGIAEFAKEMGVTHLPDLEYNERGTPIVSSAFKLARQFSDRPLLAYCNSDVILLDDFARAIDLIRHESQFDRFLAFGRRTDLDVDRAIDFSRLEDIQWLKSEAIQSGSISSQVCKEYFVFSPSMFLDMPRFAIGRGNWDNWIIHHAKTLKVPVINVSDLVTVIHQNHDYQHISENRMKCYVSGAEAKSNESLGGGRHWISGSVGTHRLTRNGIKRERPLLLNPEFWFDIPRFVRLMGSLFLGR